MPLGIFLYFFTWLHLLWTVLCPEAVVQLVACDLVMCVLSWCKRILNWNVWFLLRCLCAADSPETWQCCCVASTCLQASAALLVQPLSQMLPLVHHRLATRGVCLPNHMRHRWRDVSGKASGRTYKKRNKWKPPQLCPCRHLCSCARHRREREGTLLFESVFVTRSLFMIMQLLADSLCQLDFSYLGLKGRVCSVFGPPGVCPVQLVDRALKSSYWLTRSEGRQTVPLLTPRFWCSMQHTLKSSNAMGQTGDS